MTNLRSSAGFTLIEIMIVVGVIALILGVLIPSYMDARQGSRDKERISDLAEIEFALKSYREVNTVYPSYDSGIAIGGGADIDTDLSVFWQSTVADPVNDDTYQYFYDSNYECDGNRYVVIAARNMEQERNANLSEVCTVDSDLTGSDSYLILIEGPLSDGETTFLGVDDDIGAWWEDPENQTLYGDDGSGSDGGDGGTE